MIGGSGVNCKEGLLLPASVSPESDDGDGASFTSISAVTGDGAMRSAAEVTPTPIGKGSFFFSGTSEESGAFKGSGGALDVLLAAIETVESQSAISAPAARGF